MQQRERLELLSTLRKPQVREITREDGKRAMSFEGYAIVFNEPSVLMVDWWDKVFREYITPDAITQEMLDSTDIICTAFHNREKLLARHHADGTGTMQLTKDEIGVKVCFDFPDGPLGHDIAESVLRGDMPGMSFSFYEDNYTYIDKKGDDGIIDRTITKIDSIFEVTVASSPAYPATTAACREAWEGMTIDPKPEQEPEEEPKMEEDDPNDEKCEKEEHVENDPSDEDEKFTHTRLCEYYERDAELTELENNQ